MADEQNQQGPGYFDSRRISREQKKINKEAEKYRDFMNEASFSANNLIDDLSTLAKKSEYNNEAFRQFVNASVDLSRELSNNADLLEKIKEGELDIYDVQEKQKSSQDSINTLRSKAAQLQDKLLDDTLSGKIDEDSKAFSDMSLKIQEMVGQADDLELGLMEAMDKAKEGNTTLAKGLRGVGGILDTFGQKDLGATFKKMSGAVQKAKLAGGGFAKQMLAATKAAKLNPMLLIGSLIAKLVKTMIELNNETAELGRSFAVSAQEATEIRGHFQAIAASVHTLGVEYRDVMKQNMAFNKALGVSSVLHKDITGGAAVLAERMGMSEEATTGFMMAAVGTKKSVDSLALSSIRGARQAEAELGVRLDIKQVLEDTSKISGQLRGIFAANFETLSKSIGKAKGLGMSLGEVANVSKSLLNFQSSISAELEAELFLGKELNLEKARLASLTGDYDTFMDEIVKNAGDFFQFSKMNVMQQNKLASALGMSSDQLADMLFTQETMQSLQEKMATTTDEQTKKNLEQLSVQQQFNAAMEKMQMLLINFVSKLEKKMQSGKMPRLLRMLGFSASDKLFDVNTSLFPEQDQLDSGRQVVGAARIPVNDFIIETHPKDTLVMAGGTRLGENNNNMNSEQLNELISATKSSRSFRYDGFAAVKEAGHYGTKFS